VNDNDVGSLFVRVFFQIVLRSNEQAPQLKDKMQIIPKPNKSEYSGMRHSLNSWAKSALEQVLESEKVEVQLENILLNPISTKPQGWKLAEHAIGYNPSTSAFSRMKVNRIRNSLNEAQVKLYQFLLKIECTSRFYKFYSIF